MKSLATVSCAWLSLLVSLLVGGAGLIAVSVLMLAGVVALGSMVSYGVLASGVADRVRREKEEA